MIIYIALICISLMLLVFLYFLYYEIKSRVIAKKGKEIFDNIYEQSSPRPKYEMHYSYGYPHFTVTFVSAKELTVANEDGLNNKFSKEIEGLCKNIGSKDRPFRIEDGITFTSEEYLKNLRKM